MKLKHYTGSLDFDCDFCGLCSYNNFQIEVPGDLIVFCDKCLARARVGYKVENADKTGKLEGKS